MQAAIVGQQQQTGGILVQAAHRVNALGDVKEVDDNGFALLFTGGDIAFGFVQGDIDPLLLLLQYLSAHFHAVDHRIDFGSQFGNCLAVDLDLTLGDVDFPLAP